MSNDEHEAIAPYSTAAEIAEGRRRSEHYAQAKSNGKTELPVTATPREVLILRHGDAGDVARLAEALAKRLVTQLWSIDDRLHFLDAGNLIPVSMDVLRALIAQNFTSQMLVERSGRWEVSPCPIGDLGHQTLTDVAAALVSRVSKGQSFVRALPEQSRLEIIERLRMNEPKAAIARAYSTDIHTVQQIEATAPRRW